MGCERTFAFRLAGFQPELVAQIPLGELKLPSGGLRNKKSINFVYVRPGVRSQAG